MCSCPTSKAESSRRIRKIVGTGGELELEELGDGLPVLDDGLFQYVRVDDQVVVLVEGDADGSRATHAAVVGFDQFGQAE